MLLRPAAAGADGGDGIEVYMLRRKSSMAFAPGAYVFPGGSVDARDADEHVAWAGPEPGEWGRIFDAPPQQAAALARLGGAECESLPARIVRGAIAAVNTPR